MAVLGRAGEHARLPGGKCDPVTFLLYFEQRPWLPTGVVGATTKRDYNNFNNMFWIDLLDPVAVRVAALFLVAGVKASHSRGSAREPVCVCYSVSLLCTCIQFCFSVVSFCAVKLAVTRFALFYSQPFGSSGLSLG